MCSIYDSKGCPMSIVLHTPLYSFPLAWLPKLTAYQSFIPLYSLIIQNYVQGFYVCLF